MCSEKQNTIATKSNENDQQQQTKYNSLVMLRIADSCSILYKINRYQPHAHGYLKNENKHTNKTVGGSKLSNSGVICLLN